MMKINNLIFLILCLYNCLIFGAIKKVSKGEEMIRIEEPLLIERSYHGSIPIVMPNTRNSGMFALVDSSSNGFGMFISNSRPLYVDPENTGYWFSAYRQYAGLNNTHGQLGAAFSADGEDWEIYYNLNISGNPPWGGGGVGGAGSGQARQPNCIGSENEPVIIWHEFTDNLYDDNGSINGNRVYYSYDEFGFDGGSFAYPLDFDLLWNSDTRDHTNCSVSVSFDEEFDMSVINAVFNDVTSGGRWLFHSSDYSDGYIVMEEVQLVIDEMNDLEVPDNFFSSKNSAAYMSCIPEGICGVGIIGLFSGADTESSPISNNHTGIFKMSENHGATWHGCDGSVDSGCAPSTDSTNYYFIPDAVWDNLVNTNFNYEIFDDCNGTSSFINDFGLYYNLDFKVDRNGNPHWVIQVVPCDDDECYYTEETAGIYHFTIDKDYLDNPGSINTSTGWNWSFVISGIDTWPWDDLENNSYIRETYASLAFSTENTDIVYVVTNMATKGDFFGDEANLTNPCYTPIWEDYPSWSEDIYVIKSEDGGNSWWNPLNVSNTPDETEGICPQNHSKCDPAEKSPRAAQWGTDEEVYIQYQMPNWAFRETTCYSAACFMNRIYIGTAHVDDPDIPEYIEDDNNNNGDLNGDNIINILDIITLLNMIMAGDPYDSQSDLNSDGIVNIIDIINLVNIVLDI